MLLNPAPSLAGDNDIAMRSPEPAPDNGFVGHTPLPSASEYSESNSDEYMESDSESGILSSEFDYDDSELYLNHDGTICDNAPAAKRNHDSLTDIEDLDWNYSDSDDKRQKPAKKKLKVQPGTGKSKSAKQSREQRHKLRNGTLVVSEEKLKRWKTTIQRDDPHAEFDSRDICRVRHSICADWFRVKQAYDLTRWRAHLKVCADKVSSGKLSKKKAGISNTRTVTSYFQVATKPTTAPKSATAVEKSTQHESQDHAAPTRPCPGLSRLDNVKIRKYLRRVCVSGGGGKSIHKLSQKTFKKKFSELSRSEKDTVYEQQWHTHCWRVNQRDSKVFSTQCHKRVPDLASSTERAMPCNECFKVLNSRSFRRTLGQKKPILANQKYLNKIYRGGAMAELYAQCVGLQDLIEAPVRAIITNQSKNTVSHSSCRMRGKVLMCAMPVAY